MMAVGAAGTHILMSAATAAEKFLAILTQSDLQMSR